MRGELGNTYEKFEALLRSIGLKKNEIRIYRLLLEKGRAMRIREIQKELGISERSVREHVLNLYRKGLLKRELIQMGWLGYAYTAVSPGEILQKIKESLMKRIEELEKEFKKG
ncbi:transcriptional regulator [Pyrococcus yayanosii]|uniref:Transcription regulator, ArsR family n=1 Tax=Pyrococcus yayanosii (strain CH1 / JCM 16557) TaxID=529709 RepID=F8AGH4_PYRYC|nr:transcriptional regulator [Pyrococcus yayanosii]AEH25175.1 Transcription regulator, ArsR family [Pyrococcus yayanosii CH1]